MHDVADFRSDTVTKPTPEMRRAMAEAVVGDDVFEEDPTVNELQERAALLMAKEAALFVPTGTMANTIAIATHTRPTDEVLMDTQAHSMLFEVGGAAVIAGVSMRQFRSTDGVPDVNEIASLIQERSLHSPGTSLIILENTHNRAGGTVIPAEVHLDIREAALRRAVRIHLDGARIFNAQVATERPAFEFAMLADSVTFCLSKGLGCPAGSVLCGKKSFIASARRVRKMLGGGMRQAGILAAAGLHALTHHIDRLVDDHANAQRLSEGIAGIEGLTLMGGRPQTNMVYFQTRKPAAEVVSALRKRRVLCNSVSGDVIRMVTHLDVAEPEVDRAVEALRRAA